MIHKDKIENMICYLHTSLPLTKILLHVEKLLHVAKLLMTETILYISNIMFAFVV